MEDFHSYPFLQTLALVLGAATISTLLFQKLKQPVILGYLLAGMIVGPHIPIPLIADIATVRTLSELGVILLMFSLGLEFSIRKLLKVFPTAGFIAIFQCGLMIWLGYITGQFFGWTRLESVYAGSIIAISSTTIIIKAFSERGIQGKLTEVVFGILIVEDLVAILLLAILTPLSSGIHLSPAKLFETTGLLFSFLLTLIILGLLIVPRLFRFIIRMNRPEITLIASIGFCFTIAWMTQKFGYSVALGAFLAGSLVAESGEEKQIEHLILPVRDLFGAIFFVSVGMLINPSLIPEYWLPILVFTSLVILGKIGGVSVGAFLTGYSPRLSIKSGMSLAQIGEFSFIIATVGLTTGATRDFLYPIAVTVSAITTLLTPWLMQASTPVANAIDQHLPHSIQTFTSLYDSWMQKLKQAHLSSQSATRRLILFLSLDFTLLICIVVGISLFRTKIIHSLTLWIHIPEPLPNILILLVTGACALPFFIGIIQCSRRLGWVLATGIIPTLEKGTLDLATAPRRALVITLQLMIILIMGITLLAITQPFLPILYSSITFGVLLIFLGISFWRGAENLQGHIQSGAEMVLEALTPADHSDKTNGLPSLEQLLPGIGKIISIPLKNNSSAIGKTLSEIDLRGLTGASVIAITRNKPETGIVAPTGKEKLQAHDILTLVGTPEAIENAKKILSDFKE